MSGVTLSTLVEAALTGRAYNQARFGEQAKRYARKITNYACRDFPEDRHEEVAQQAIAELWGMGAAALTGTTGQALFRRAVFAAIRVVRSDYAAPGQRTRRPAKGAPPEPARVAPEDIARIADAETAERCTVGKDEEARIEFDLFESAAAAADFRHSEDRVELEWALRSAPQAVAAALQLVCIRGESLSFAAAEVGVSRFSLSRKLDAFCPKWRLAA